MRQQGLAQNDQKWKFRAKCGHLGGKIPNYTGESKSYGTHITEKTPRHLVCIVHGQAWDQMSQKCQYLAHNDQKCMFWTKFGCFWAKNSNFYAS